MSTIAATPDDGYNALVCTRFAAELGRERVYQIASKQSGERQATSREWRGKIAVADDMTHERLAMLMSGGAAFVIEPASGNGARDPTQRDESWPTAALAASGGFAMYGPDQQVATSEGDLLIKLYHPALAPIAPSKRKIWSRAVDRYRSRSNSRTARTVEA